MDAVTREIAGLLDAADLGLVVEKMQPAQVEAGIEFVELPSGAGPDIQSGNIGFYAVDGRIDDLLDAIALADHRGAGRERSAHGVDIDDLLGQQIAGRFPRPRSGTSLRETESLPSVAFAPIVQVCVG